MLKTLLFTVCIDLLVQKVLDSSASSTPPQPPTSPTTCYPHQHLLTPEVDSMSSLEMSASSLQPPSPSSSNHESLNIASPMDNLAVFAAKEASFSASQKLWLLSRPSKSDEHSFVMVVENELLQFVSNVRYAITFDF